MTKTETQRLTDIRTQANQLLDAGSSGSGITNMDVMEAMLGDIELVQMGSAPRHLIELIARDN